MGKKMVPKIILEGTRMTHKTDVAFALNKHPRFVGPRKYEYHSPLVSGEWCAFTNFPWGRGLINFSEEEEAKALETFQTWVRLIELQRYYSWIIDRFHISTKLYQKEVNGRDYDFRWLEERLKNLDFRIVLLTRKDESFEEARKERLKVSGNPSQYDDLKPFVEEQQRFKTLVNDSLLKSIEIDVSDENISRVTNEICDWYETTGGIYTDN